MISTLYVALRLDNHIVRTDAERNLGVETLGYTDSKEDGMRFLEIIAAKDVHGKDWSYERNGDPFYDPEDEDCPKPEPGKKFAVWDEDLELDDPMVDRPTSVVASASVFSGGEDRCLLRSYKLCRTNPTVADFTRATTEGDLEMERQIRSGKSTL